MAPKFKTTKKRLDIALRKEEANRSTSSEQSDKQNGNGHCREPHGVSPATTAAITPSPPGVVTQSKEVSEHCPQNGNNQQQNQQQQQQQMPTINMKSEMSKNHTQKSETLVKSPSNLSTMQNGPQKVTTPTIISTPKQQQSCAYYSYKETPAASTFSWDLYLERIPAQVAPREAFRQTKVYPQNQFRLGMKLEARDPRNSSNWCLASVVNIEGLHLRLRFEGADAMNDLYELIDSDNIRPVGSSPSELLLAPTGFTGNIAQYPRFVEKVLKADSSIIAPPEIFPPSPPIPATNLFKPGMKIEAVDLKNRDFICPATIGAVAGDTLDIVFDGWRGSFDYKCKYTSREIFPINWCRDVGRVIQAPNGWKKMLEKGVAASPLFTPEIKSSASFKNRAGFRNDNRGRPKKNGTNNKSHTKLHSPTRPKTITSTPKKNEPPNPFNNIHLPTTLETPSSPPTPSDESPSTPPPASPRLDDMYPYKTERKEEPSINRYQCQRTVSFMEWQRKKLDEQMPRFEIPSDIKDNKDTVDNSFNLSDTASMASTLSNQRDSKDSTDQTNPVKRHKPESPPLSSSSASPLKKLLQIKPKKLSMWTVEDVLDVIKTEETLLKYVQTFQENEIDGKAFGLFDERKTDLLMSMGLKLGPVLKVLYLREQISLHMEP